MADWHYIGHYGQLGPLNDTQMAELIAGGVIERETYVWCEGMADWLAAYTVTELSVHFKSAPSKAVPPPPPPQPSSTPPPFNAGAGVLGRDLPGAPHLPPIGPGVGAVPPGSNYYAAHGAVPQPGAYGSGSYGMYPSQRSDKSKVLAGILNCVIPGVGRMYLGYPVIGVLQLVLLPLGIGYLWALVDGLLILTGNVKEDGYGRELP